jgi:hypothetical protein
MKIVELSDGTFVVRRFSILDAIFGHSPWQYLDVSRSMLWLPDEKSLFEPDVTLAYRSARFPSREVAQRAVDKIKSPNPVKRIRDMQK